MVVAKDVLTSSGGQERFEYDCEVWAEYTCRRIAVDGPAKLFDYDALFKEDGRLRKEIAEDTRQEQQRKQQRKQQQ